LQIIFCVATELLKTAMGLSSTGVFDTLADEYVNRAKITNDIIPGEHQQNKLIKWRNKDECY